MKAEAGVKKKDSDEVASDDDSTKRNVVVTRASRRQQQQQHGKAATEAAAGGKKDHGQDDSTGNDYKVKDEKVNRSVEDDERLQPMMTNLSCDKKNSEREGGLIIIADEAEKGDGRNTAITTRSGRNSRPVTTTTATKPIVGHKSVKKGNENKKQCVGWRMYDESGCLLSTGMDMCDCLDVDCPGCHFPCLKCGSEKCGTECRCERSWIYEEVKVEGTNLVVRNPSIETSTI